MSSPYSHYIVVRRDLTFGQILSAVTHAAGESFYLLCPDSSGSERQVDNLEVGSSQLPRGATFKPDETIAVVLGARNEGRLKRLVEQLKARDVAHVPIIETDGARAGELLAVGLIPGPKSALAVHVREFHMFQDYKP